MFPELFENEKIILIRIIKDKIRFAYDTNNFYNSHTVINCVKYDKLIRVCFFSQVFSTDNFFHNFFSNNDSLSTIGGIKNVQFSLRNDTSSFKSCFFSIFSINFLTI